MKVIRHEHEFIESKCSALAISIDRFDKQFRGPLRTKNGLALRPDGRDEKCAFNEFIHITVTRLKAASSGPRIRRAGSPALPRLLRQMIFFQA